MKYAFVLILTLLTASAVAREAPYQELTWNDLMPPGEWDNYKKEQDYYMRFNQVQEGGAMDQAVQFGNFNVVKDLDGKKVRIPGFVLPMEYGEGKKIAEFLLVPYFGACLHSPPPPPNQIVYVVADKPAELELWEPIWAEGTLSAEKNENDLGNAAYTLHLEHWEKHTDDN